MEILSLLWLIIVIVVIVAIVRDDGSAGHKVLWIILVILFPLIGMICYFIFGGATKNIGT